MWSTLVEKLRSVTLIAVPLISRVCEIFSFRCPVFHESARFVFSLELTHRDHVNARCTESPEIEISFYLKKAKQKGIRNKDDPLRHISLRCRLRISRGATSLRPLNLTGSNCLPAHIVARLLCLFD